MAHRDQFFGDRVHSQHGEDIIFLNLFHWLGVERPSYLSIGAHHPFDLNNTALLYERRGSRGTCVEANPDLIPKWSARPGDKIINAAVIGDPMLKHVTLFRAGRHSGINSTIREQVMVHGIRDEIVVPATTLRELLSGMDRWPDLLEIDAEGRDLEILRSTELRGSSIKVVCAEAYPVDVVPEFRDVMANNGYRVHMRAAHNVIFVREDLWELVH